MSLIARPLVVRAEITQSFGPTSLGSEPALYGYGHFHTGVDYACPVGSDVLASFDGVVTLPAYDPLGYGRYIVLDDGRGLQSLVAHLSRVIVAHGQKVKRGQVIAKSGNTGNSTGPHLHWSLIYQGMYTHPWPWVAERQ
jgi:murein DD-endopeptidase MepM/ murein hydrolase activator NlpD